MFSIDENRDLEVYVIVQDCMFKALANAGLNSETHVDGEMNYDFWRKFKVGIIKYKLSLLGESFQPIEKGNVYDHFPLFSLQGFTPEIHKYMKTAKVSERIMNMAGTFERLFTETNIDFVETMANNEARGLKSDDMECYVFIQAKMLDAVNYAMLDVADTCPHDDINVEFWNVLKLQATKVKINLLNEEKEKYKERDTYGIYRYFYMVVFTWYMFDKAKNHARTNLGRFEYLIDQITKTAVENIDVGQRDRRMQLGVE